MPQGPPDKVLTLQQCCRTQKERMYADGRRPWDGSLTCSRLLSRLKARGVAAKIIDGQLVLE